MMVVMVAVLMSYVSTAARRDLGFSFHSKDGRSLGSNSLSMNDG